MRGRFWALGSQLDPRFDSWDHDLHMECGAINRWELGGPSCWAMPKLWVLVCHEIVLKSLCWDTVKVCKSPNSHPDFCWSSAFIEDRKSCNAARLPVAQSNHGCTLKISWQRSTAFVKNLEPRAWQLDKLVIYQGYAWKCGSRENLQKTLFAGKFKALLPFIQVKEIKKHSGNGYVNAYLSCPGYAVCCSCQ